MAGSNGEAEKARVMVTSAGFCYSDASSSGDPNLNFVSQLQSFHSEIYNTAAMEIINGLYNPSNKHHDHPHNLIAPPDHTSYHHHHHQESHVLIPCDQENEMIRPTHIQGLSLSLSSSDLIRSQNHDDLRSFMGGPSQYQIRNSKYLEAAQELLNEFCNIGTADKSGSRMKTSEYQDENIIAAKKQSLYSLDLVELQKRKTKLLHMLQEVDRRYKHYCDQMKAVVSLFEAAAGNGTAKVYSAMASRAMSRHFRCLKDGIVSQIKVTKAVMGEKDGGAAGTSKGETPRLRILDQTLRQQRALQQMSMMESHPWRPQRGLPEKAVSVLRAWLFEHFLHPYPSDVDKHILARQTGLSRGQVSNWFINARVRLWKPMVEEMYLEDQKEGGAATDDHDHGALDRDAPDQNPPSHHEDQKPSHEQLMIRTTADSEWLSTIINNNNNRKNEYGAMQFDFSSGGGGAAFSYLNDCGGGGGGGSGGGGGVSLTLGLQQNGAGGGVSLAFSPAYGHPQMDQTVQFSVLDGENQNLPYRNLMGAHLLHDLAG